MRLGFSAVGSLLLVLAGCAVSRTAAPIPEVGVAIRGNVRGGQQPISGMHVYLMAANTSGYGNASVSLLNAGSSGASDSVGAYVLSGTDGSFSITGDYTCTAGSQVYLYGVGGNPGAGVNSSAGLMAVLGNCPTAGDFVGTTPFIAMNEVSTVAAAYAMAGFATDPTHVSSSGTAQAQVGIANAFLNAASLETLSTGNALATTPSGTGSVPQSARSIRWQTSWPRASTRMGRDRAAAVCLRASTPNGGTTPTDTAQAALNVAHSPGAQVSTLYGLVGSTPPFQPTLAIAPTDWTVGLTYNTFSLIGHTVSMAIDGSGNVWLGSGAGSPSVLMKLSSTGLVLSGASGYAVAGSVNQISIDPSGNVWVTAGSSGGLSKFSNSGTLLLQLAAVQVPGMQYPYAIALDGSGNAWIGNSNATGLFKLANDGTVLSPAGGFATGSTNYFSEFAIDGSGNVWIQANASGVLEYSNAGVLLSGASGYSVSAGGPLAIDAAGDAWMFTSLSNNALYELSSTGAVLSPAGIHACDSTAAAPHSCAGLFAGASEPLSVAVDGSGNIWSPVAYYGPVTRTYFNGITELSNAGTILSGNLGYHTSGSESFYPSLLQVDSSGDVWGAEPCICGRIGWCCVAGGHAAVSGGAGG